MIPPKLEIPALPKCKRDHEIPIHVTFCVVCGENVGFPNVRYAERKEEEDALGRRVADARVSAQASKSIDRLEAFGKAVDGSNAVVSRYLEDLNSMVAGAGKLMQAYHPAVRAHLRMPQNNEHDPVRTANDSRVNPEFYDRLHFAALSLDGRGVPHYGDYAIALREDMIDMRSTVFEENPVLFNEKHPLGRNRPLPFGYRTTWKNRGKLAMAKLQHKIAEATRDDEFPGILMEKQAAPDGYSDFIEVHVYGDLHPQAFAHIVAQIPDDEIEKILWERTKTRLNVFGITFEELGV